MSNTTGWTSPLGFQNSGKYVESAFGLGASLLALTISGAFAYMTTKWDGLSAEEKEKYKKELTRVEEIGKEIHDGATNFMHTEFKYLMPPSKCRKLPARIK